MCTPDLYAKGVCEITPDPPISIPEEFQYFSDPTKGGDSPLADYCPSALPYSNGWCTDPANSGSSGIINTGEAYSPNSRCFASSLLKGALQPTAKASCYNVQCASESLAKVQINDGSNWWYDCQDGQKIDYIPFFGGSLQCPDHVTRLCGGVQPDLTWPTVTSITPTSAVPTTAVTIIGTGFDTSASVDVNGPCTNVVVVSDTQITASLPDYEYVTNLENFLGKKSNVVVINAGGKTSILPQVFTYQLNIAAIKGVALWLKDHWYVALMVAVVIVVIFALLFYCCCRKKKNYGRNAPRDNY